MDFEGNLKRIKDSIEAARKAGATYRVSAMPNSKSTMLAGYAVAQQYSAVCCSGLSGLCEVH
jgi:hypothetical protein